MDNTEKLSILLREFILAFAIVMVAHILANEFKMPWISYIGLTFLFGIIMAELEVIKRQLRKK